MNGQTLTTLTPDPPLLPAHPRADGLSGLQVWCSPCFRWHFHGTGYGHRAAHCHIHTSPYRKSGYVLVGPSAIEVPS